MIATREKRVDYLIWKQQDAWRNRNNAYPYWTLRKISHKPLEVAKMLQDLKSEKLHDLLFQHGVNLAKTSAWQRKAILICRKPCQKRLEDTEVKPGHIEGNWNLSLFSSAEGNDLIQRIIDWAKPF